MFTTIFSLNGIFGFVVLGLFLWLSSVEVSPELIPNVSPTLMYCQSKVALWVCVSLSCFTNLAFYVLVTPFEPPSTVTPLYSDKEGESTASLSIVDSLSATMTVFADYESLCLAPFFYLCGTLEGFFWGVVCERMSETVISVAFICNGVASVAMSYASGHLAENYGRRRVLIPLCVVSLVSCTGVGIVMTDIGGHLENEFSGSKSTIFVVTVALFGIVDLPAQGLLRSLMTSIHMEKGTVIPAMGFVVFMLSGGVVSAMVYGPHLSPWIQAVFVNAVTLMSIAGLWLLPPKVGHYVTKADPESPADVPVRLQSCHGTAADLSAGSTPGP